MSTPHELIEMAFDRLAAKPGYSERPDQRQLALLLGDLMEAGTTGMIEAPTGLGKSLAGLVPAVAHAIASGKRTVIATYTNVLAEQYWRQDLPLALSLFAGHDRPTTALLMGRQRYACLASMEEHAPHRIDDLLASTDLGIESDFRAGMRAAGMPGAEAGKLWRQVAAPAVCPARSCPHYDPCYYYTARKKAEKALVVISNHAVVLQDALMASVEDEETGEKGRGLLGKIDFLILDEAHDVPQAALNAFEFELDIHKLNGLLGMATRLEKGLGDAATFAGDSKPLDIALRGFREGIAAARQELEGIGLVGTAGILDVAPHDLRDHPAIKMQWLGDGAVAMRRPADIVSEACGRFERTLTDMLKAWREEEAVPPEKLRLVNDSIRNYLLYISEAKFGAEEVGSAREGGVSYVGQRFFGQPAERALLRHDLIDFKETLRGLLWDRGPWACLSATLALDGSFDYFEGLTGAKPGYQEVLASPFDFGSQAALYLPREGVVPDPTVARKEGTEDVYHAALARELTRIIKSADGRTLVLFHSRKEMEATYLAMEPDMDHPIYVQPRTGAAAIGDRFRKEIRSSLFALRSFWTGFDAPGETLSCVVLVRVPFEVPIDPPALARAAMLQKEGRNPFADHALPQAKMLIRQGVGRLIRRATDKGIIALLDPRLKTKRYGDEILDNLPGDMRRFDDIDDAVGWIGLAPIGK